MTHSTPDTPHADPFAQLNAQGLNLQAVFNVRDLPDDVQTALPPKDGSPYRQLLLIGHRGRLLWQQLALQGMVGEHPVDAFTRDHVNAWLASEQPGLAHCFVYPGPTSVGLQRLGVLAGWHHASPFMVGVNDQWGSWFAYRAVVLADTCLAPTPSLNSTSPCITCATRICVSHCPAKALDNGYDLAACLAYRQQSDSGCQDRCLARNSCPVGEAHRYSDAQISYHYGRSMHAIEKWQYRGVQGAHS